MFYAHELGFEPITTPAYSPQSNGMAEAFVKTLKRDYVAGADLRDAESVLLQLAEWFEDYNTRAPECLANHCARYSSLDESTPARGMRRFSNS